MIGQLAKGEGKTILISSHILTELGEMCDLVGIIEKGQLLAVGSVDEIRNQSGTEREVRIGVLSNAAKMVAWLQNQDQLSNLRQQGEMVRMIHHEDRNFEASLLKQLIENGFEVAEFGSEEKSLEEVFMHVTRGNVQ